MSAQPPKKLPKVDFNLLSSAESRLTGYQKIDDNTVLYRRFVPMDQWRKASLMQIFDFTTYQMSTLVENRGGNTGEYTTNMTVTPFSEIENKQGIRDAHQALVEQGGTPPALDQVLSLGMRLEKDLPVRGTPVTFKPKGSD